MDFRILLLKNRFYAKNFGTIKYKFMPDNANFTKQTAGKSIDVLINNKRFLV